MPFIRSNERQINFTALDLVAFDLLTTMGNAIWYLKRCSLFELITAEQAARIERAARLKTFRTRDIIYAPGEPGATVLVLAKGRVKVKDVTPDGKETILAFIEQGEIFGEMALFEAEPRQEYAEATEPSSVLSLPTTELFWLMEQHPQMALSITKIIGLRRRRIENRLRNVLFYSSRDRLIHLLRELADAYGEQIGDLYEIRLPFSHHELAGLIGVSRETVTNVLGQLQLEGSVRVARRRITILDWKSMSAAESRAA